MVNSNNQTTGCFSSIRLLEEEVPALSGHVPGHVWEVLSYMVSCIEGEL